MNPIANARRLRPIVERAAQSLTDDVALTAPMLYPTWEDCLKLGTVEYDKPGFKFSYGDKLFRCINPNPTFQADWVPGIDTASLYTEICETHAGTADDPIPAARNMEYTYGLIYLDPEDGKLYLCSRDREAEGGKITLNYLPHELVGLYFEVI